MDNKDNLSEDENIAEDIGQTMVYKAVDAEIAEAVVEDEAAQQSDEAEHVERKKRKKANGKNKAESNRTLNIILASVSVAVILLCGIYYYIGYVYFGDRFYRGTEINGIDCSDMTVSEVYAIFEKAVSSYELSVKKDGVLLDTVYAEDVGLNTGNTLESIEAVCDRQQHFDWAKYYIKPVKTEADIANVYEYDADKFASVLEGLRSMSYTPTKKSINAKLQYTDGNYRIVPEVYGDEISKEALKDVILDCMQSLKPEINIEKSNCYIMPSVTEHTESIVAAKDKLNKILDGNMTLKLISREVPMTRDAVNSWIKIDENFNVSANESTIGSYVSILGNKYSSYGKDRAFKTTYGDTVTVAQGDYGRKVNEDLLKERMVEAINTAENMTVDVPFSRGAMGSLENDLGTTYVEIDLTNQRLWMYVNGKQVVFTDVVTGKDDGTHYTPQGTYKLKYKQKNAILRGDNYATPVAWWMPFNGDIGLHDATWQPTFGGDRYKLNGSHGCVNLPLDKAEQIFNNAVVGMPVICYYHAKADVPVTTTTTTTTAQQ